MYVSMFVSLVLCLFVCVLQGDGPIRLEIL